jgi:beta-carotene/zeaxanthin 4-ketolase
MGVLIAIAVIGLWGGHLWYILSFVEVSWTNPWMYLHMAFQAYLYTGLFITGHDAMHRSVSRVKWINNAVGYLSVFLFAGMSYPRLIRNHWDHHRYPGTEKDPDFYEKSQNFFAWWFTFLKRYTTLMQIVAMAVIFNLLQHLAGFSVPVLVVFWIIPAFMATFQLFYFGTYVPHRKPHTEEMGKHRARSLVRNHLWAMLSCYFFGYHYEHHAFPGKPWWKLYRVKDQSTPFNDH